MWAFESGGERANGDSRSGCVPEWTQSGKSATRSPPGRHQFAGRLRAGGAQGNKELASMHDGYLTATVGALLVAMLLSLGAILLRGLEAGEISEATIVNLRASVP
jgi:hypothetical protein